MPKQIFYNYKSHVKKEERALTRSPALSAGGAELHRPKGEYFIPLFHNFITFPCGCFLLMLLLINPLRSHSRTCSELVLPKQNNLTVYEPGNVFLPGIPDILSFSRRGNAFALLWFCFSSLTKLSFIFWILQLQYSRATEGDLEIFQRISFS